MNLGFSELRKDMQHGFFEVRKESAHQFRWLVSFYIAGFTSLLAIMAKGFHWL